MEKYPHGSPLPNPNMCVVCEESRAGRDDDFVDTGYRFEIQVPTRLDGVKMLCERCIRSAAKEFDLVDGAEIEEAGYERDRAVAELEALKRRVEFLATDIAASIDAPAEVAGEGPVPSDAPQPETEDKEVEFMAKRERVHAGEPVAKDEFSREELDRIAGDFGVDSTGLQNKAAVVDAIIEARKSPKEE